MPRLIIQDLENGRVRQLRLQGKSLTIGKLDDNDLKLTGPGKTVSAAKASFRTSFGADEKGEEDYEL